MSKLFRHRFKEMYEIINKDIYYNGYKFEHVKQEDEPEEDTDNLEEDILVQDKDIIIKEIDIRLTCGCGSEIYKKYQKKHEKTKKHQDYILKNNM